MIRTRVTLMIVRGAAIAQWICLRLPSCCPRFLFQAHHLCLYQLILISVMWKIRKWTKWGRNLAHFLKTRLIVNKIYRWLIRTADCWCQKRPLYNWATTNASTQRAFVRSSFVLHFYFVLFYGWMIPWVQLIGLLLLVNLKCTLLLPTCYKTIQTSVARIWVILHLFA